MHALQQNDMSIPDFYFAISNLWDQLALVESKELKDIEPYIVRRKEQHLAQFLMVLCSDFEGLRGMILLSSPSLNGFHYSSSDC